jgi:hypothetical protein
MTKRTASKNTDWSIEAINDLPADATVPKGTQRYNVYRTQKEHWLGWLDPSAGTGIYHKWRKG